MQLLEPTTAITDWILAIECFFFGHMLFWHHGKISNNQTFKHIKAFGLFFLFIGMGSLFGGIAHGFNYLSESYPLFKYVWVITVLCIGKASFYLGCAIVLRFFDHLQKIILPMLALKFLIYVLLAFGIIPNSFYNNGDVSFSLVIMDYAPIQFWFFVMMLFTFLKTKSIHHSTVVSGLLLSFMGSLLQAFKVSPHPMFNHNDLYHVIQMLALFLVYKGIVMETNFLRERFKPLS